MQAACSDPATCNANLVSGTFNNPFVYKWTYASQTSAGAYTGGYYSQIGYGYNASTGYNATYKGDTCRTKGYDSCSVVSR